MHSSRTHRFLQLDVVHLLLALAVQLVAVLHLQQLGMGQ